MARRTAILSFFLIATGFYLSAQPPRIVAFDYIDQYQKIAERQMENYGVPASVILAQAIFESGCGKSELAKRSNNHFGIKCHTTWLGDTVTKTDDYANECFRKYSRVEDSYRDHSIFLRTRMRYADLFRLPLTDYKSWCRGLKEAGYATYSTYAEELIRIIEQNNLQALDLPDRLEPVTGFARVAEIRKPKRTDMYLSASTLAQKDLLFSDESHFVIRSLGIRNNSSEGQPGPVASQRRGKSRVQ